METAKNYNNWVDTVLVQTEIRDNENHSELEGSEKLATTVTLCVQCIFS